ncbi:MAG: O-antigen ligase domain-containing protein, partial [Nonlabens sp.]|nr:O-antigen ligase domain-containing protein [Nonlabens sp.]
MIRFEKLPYPILIGGHVVLTIFMIALPLLVKVFFYAILVYLLLRVFLNQDRNREVLLAGTYLCCLEVFLRMNSALPFFEMMKYLIIIFSMLGIFIKGFSLKSVPYAFFLLLLVPSIVIAAQNIPLGESLRKSVAFNLSGPVALGISAIYCYRTTITMERLDEILKFAVGPIVMITTYLFVVTPDIRDVVTDTASNFATSGGYGPNQVATALGIGMFIC